ncbi:MAG: serine hydrolase [Gammaproteobacteria bacterium]|nr:serine hydrolase [Gammaproteobacteria bacterium]MCW5583916.1 serine hydrolase [Gammaproteobacteria bacterium]
MHDRVVIADESSITEAMEKTDISGISIALVSDDGVITTKEFGFSGKESKNKVAQDTIFGAASLSKVVFAYLVLKLVQDHQLSLDENLSKTLSFGDFCNQVSLHCDPSIKDTTLDIHSILSHTTGLDDSKDGVVQKTESGNYWYSGVPLWYLQKVIETKMGKSLEELAKKYVFAADACDMKHSTFYREYGLAPILGPLKPTHQAQTLYIKTDNKEGVSYEVIGLDGQLKHNTIPWNELPKDFPRNVTDIIRTKETSLPALLRWTCSVNHTTKESALSANSLFTTAEDYAKFVKKWMNEEDELLKSAFTQVISMKKDDWANAVGVSKNDLKRVAWGLGWGLELDAKGQVKKAYHTGDMNNWRAWVAIDFDKKEAIVYFSNSPNGHVLANQVVSPHVALPHALSYFSKKYGFAVKYEPDWKNKEKAQFALIKHAVLTYATPKISQLQSSFFKTAITQQTQAENRLMPASVSWWEQELREKREILENFWWERIIKLNQNSVDEFKKHVINTHFPKSSEWEKKIDKLFSDAIARKIDFDDFFAELKYLPMIHIRGMANFEKIPIPHASEAIEPKSEIEAIDLINIKRYMVERDMTGSVSFGFENQGIITPNYSDGSRCSYAMHSVGKVFTGMLTLLMIRDGVLTEKELNEPLSKDFIESLALSESIKKHLSENQVTLHQLMTHKAGLGDYLGDYGEAISQGKTPEMNKAEDFLQFAETSTSPVGKEKYSNLGILLVGLAVKHACEKKHGACEYNELLSKYIIDPVGMPSFSSKKPEHNAKYNPEDSIAPHIAGSPAGGYWVTTEDLAKFGQWIYKSCSDDPNLLMLIKKYGQEFYNEEYNMISHGGAISSSSAFLSVSLNTGAVIATLSDQPDMAFELNSMMQTHVFAKRPEAVEEEIEISYKKEF